MSTMYADEIPEEETLRQQQMETQRKGMEEVSAYVSRLKARRNEEAASRKNRSQRRADTVNSNMEAFKKRSANQRRRLMNEKLGMTSQIEHHLFTMLEEQSKWRHVMYQNVVDQEDHLDEMVHTQENLDGGYMEGLVKEEQEVFQEMVHDDQHRWAVQEAEEKHSYDNEVKDICHGVLLSAQRLAEKVIEFHTINDLGTDPVAVEGDEPKSMFDTVPKALFREWMDSEIYPQDGDRQEKTLQDHVSLRQFHVDPTAAEDIETNNGLFSGLTYKLQKLHQPDPDLFHPVKPQSKAIIALSGPNYSGKSSAAAEVAKNLNLWHLSDTDMIQRAMDEMEREIGDTDPDLQSPEEVNRAELMDIGVEIRRTLQEGQTVGDELMAQLVLNHIDTLEFLTFDGVLFDACPGNNKNVFELVEAKLCNFDKNRTMEVPKKLLAPKLSVMPPVDDAVFTVERPPTPPPEAVAPGKEKKEKKQEKKKKDEQEEPLPPLDLPVVDPVPPLTEEEEATLKELEKTGDKFGTHCTVQMVLRPEDVYQRFAGIRVDQDTGDRYHLENNAPPLTSMPRVAACERADSDAVNLHIAAHDDGSELTKWVGRYSTVATVDAHAPLAQVTTAIQSIAESTLGKVQRDYQLQVAAEELQKNRQEMELMFQERTTSREAIRKQLAAIYTERGVDPLPAELAEGPPKVEESHILPVPKQFPPVFLRMLDDFTNYYKQGLCNIHAELAKLVASVYSEGRCCMSNFNSFWKQPDTKQPLLTNFCSEFNTMQPALRRDVQGKDELHLRVDDLADALAAIAEKRRDEAITVIDQLLAHNVFVDHWCDAVRLMGGALIQLELERFYLIKQLSCLYFNAVKGETVTIDEAETTTEVLPQPRSSAEALAAAAEAASKEKKDKKPAPKKGKEKEKERRESVHEDHSPDKLEDHFTPVIERAVAAMRSCADRLTGPTTPIPTTKADKKKAQAEVPQTPDLPATGSLASPLVNAEFELAKKRMETIGRYIQQILEEGHSRSLITMKQKMQARSRKHYLDEMSAVNGALFLIRTAIEEERPVDHSILLDGSKYRVDLGHPLVPPRIQPMVSSGAAGGAASGLGRQTSTLTGSMVAGGAGAAASGSGVPPEMDPTMPSPLLSVNVSGGDDSGVINEDEIMLTSVLKVARAFEMVKLFKTIAPDYLIHEADFLTVVRQSDYDVLKPAASPVDMFKRFDLLECGAIDWREFMIHIMFFVEPQISDSNKAAVAAIATSGGLVEGGDGDELTSGAFGGAVMPRNPFYVETPSLFQLLDFRQDIGMEQLVREEYDDIPFFFEVQMEGERLESFRNVIWEIFSRVMPLPQPEQQVGGADVTPPVEGALRTSNEGTPVPAAGGVNAAGENIGAGEVEMAELVDPNVMVMFFCADEQPLRGIQKAFAMGSSVPDENCVLTAEQVLQVFHFNACNAAKLGMQDPYDFESVLSIFQLPNGTVAETLSFPDACGTQNGRMLLNNTYMYRQRSFTPEKKEGGSDSTTPPGTATGGNPDGKSTTGSVAPSQH